MQDQMKNPPQAQESVEENLNEILRVRRQKLQALKDEGKDPFSLTHYERTHESDEIISHYDELEGQQVSIAGRMTSRRIMGKASFAHVLDRAGTIQIYVKRDDVGQDAYTAFKQLDIGDILGVKGTVFKTRTGEISLHVTEYVLLAKSLQPLPEKFHGLSDPDLRYRQRYVDMIVNPEVRKTFMARSQIIKIIRRILDERGFIEVETPVLHTLATGAAAKPFITHHNSLDIDMYLRIETELHLKRLIVGGLERVYEIGRIFRNEGMDIKHNPEFTTIELYQAYTNLEGMMEVAETVFIEAAKAVCGGTQITYQGTPVDLTGPWRRLPMIDAVKEYAGIDFTDILDDEGARAATKAAGLEVEADMTRGQCIYLCFDELVEEKLVQPTFITDYPVEVSPLAKRKVDDPAFTERFEFFITGREMGNAFSELNDPIDQKARFVEQAQKKMAGEGEAQIDDDFVNALEVGMPPTGGMGIGIDRMVMLLTDSYSIRDVILFPTMKLIKN
jgi:lysyl-tRNA synthetase class 2